MPPSLPVMFEQTDSVPWAIAVFDIDGVVRDVAGSYRRAIADTVEQFTAGQYRPTMADIDTLKAEGVWNNDWEASQELVYRFYETQQLPRTQLNLEYKALVAFFQSRYRGENFSGYIRHEPLLVTQTYLEGLTQAGVLWGFFSGATRGSATYVLTERMGLENPVLIAMEDAPGKPDPTGLVATAQQLLQDWSYPSSQSIGTDLPIFYAGDTVADMQTVLKARDQHPTATWIGIGILPPHIQNSEKQEQYGQGLQLAGATTVLPHVEQLTPELMQHILRTTPSWSN